MKPKVGLARILWWTRLSELARVLIASRGRFVLEFHGVVAGPEPTIESRPAMPGAPMTRTDLDRILEWVSARFEFLTVSDLLDTERPGVLLTFDDGFANNFTNVLPMLREYRAPAVFFVTTQHLQEPRNWLPATRIAAARAGHEPGSVPVRVSADLYDGMSVDQLRSCVESGLVTVGCHTVSHPSLTSCSDAELESELSESKAYLEENCDRPVDLLAYPSGDYDQRVMAAAKRLGYRAAFVEHSRRLGVVAFEIPRIGIYSSEPAYLGAKLSGLFRRSLGTVASPQTRVFG